MDDSYQDATSVPLDDASVSLNGNGGATSSTTGGPLCIGRVGAPPQKEATSTNFFFWLVHLCLIPYVVFGAYLLKEFSGGIYKQRPLDPIMVMQVALILIFSRR